MGSLGEKIGLVSSKALGQPGMTKGRALILEEFSGAIAAYSLRRLSTGYSGSACRIRVHSMGDPEYDIGFDANGDLDTAYLTSLIGSNDASVVTWYGQSSGGVNMTQSDTTKQPLIANAGTIITEGGKPAIEFDGTNDGFVSTLSLAVSTPFNAFCVHKTSDAEGVLYWGNNTSRWAFIIDNNISTNISVRFVTSNVYKDGVSQSINNRQDYYNAFSTGTRHLSYIRGTIDTDSWPEFSIFGYTGFSLGGRCQEVIVFGVDKLSQRTDIEANINGHYTIY